MREFQRSFPPFPIQAQQQESQDSSLDWGSKEWGTHRYYIRQLIEHSLGSIPMKDHVIVLGAGNHGDVDLPGLAEQFARVTVLDTEANSIEEMLGQSPGMMTGGINSLASVDYTGLDQILFYETWEEMLLNQTPVSEMISYIRNCAFKVRRLEPLAHLKKSGSLVISSAVHTQLFYISALTQFAGYASNYVEHDVRQVIDALTVLRNSLITDYNRMLISLVKPGGRIVMWSDMIRLDQSNRSIQEGLYALQTEEERIRYLFRAFGQFGMEAAVLGLKDLHDQLSPSAQLFKCWVWLQSAEKQYITAGFSASPCGE